MDTHPSLAREQGQRRETEGGETAKRHTAVEVATCAHLAPGEDKGTSPARIYLHHASNTRLPKLQGESSGMSGCRRCVHTICAIRTWPYDIYFYSCCGASRAAWIHTHARACMRTHARAQTWIRLHMTHDAHVRRRAVLHFCMHTTPHMHTTRHHTCTPYHTTPHRTTHAHHTCTPHNNSHRHTPLPAPMRGIRVT